MEDRYIGQMLDNRYEIQEKIGSGGMAIVYKAMDHRLSRLVAVKILKEELAQDEEFRHRFHTEAQAVAMLSHPNIVAVYDVSKTGSTEYIVMELIDGITLKQYINRKGILSWKEALHFATQITKALIHAHSRGIIHRDIKPHNIMILKDGSVKVADFGIARLLNNQNTLTQEALGSVHYISPEQAKGGHVDARSDIYSVGVVLYEMLTGRLPFEGDSAISIALQHISCTPLLPSDLNPDVPKGLEQITMHAMEPKLELRYVSAEELLRDLDAFRQDPDLVFDYSGETPSLPDDGTRVINTGAVTAAIASETGRNRSAEIDKRKEKELKPSKQKGPKSEEENKKEYGKNRKRASKTSILIGIFSVIVLLVLLFVFMWNYLLRGMLNPGNDRVTIPSFVGQMYDKVKSDSDYKNTFTFDVTYQTNDQYEEGYILDQDPDAERQVANDLPIPIKLTVSSGSEAQTMPNIVNEDYRQAKSDLEAMNLNLDIQMTPTASDTVTKGYVMDQFPAEGATLVKGETIYITYSSGPETEYVEVPYVYGYTEAQAISRLQAYELTYSSQEVESNLPKGTVVSQSIEAGTKVPLHTEVVLEISLGPTTDTADTTKQTTATTATTAAPTTVETSSPATTAETGAAG